MEYPNPTMAFSFYTPKTPEPEGNAVEYIGDPNYRNVVFVMASLQNTTISIGRTCERLDLYLCFRSAPCSRALGLSAISHISESPLTLFFSLSHRILHVY